MRQTFFTIEKPQASGEVNPVPGLFEMIVGKSSLKLAFEDAAGGVGADLRQSSHLKHVMHSRPQARFYGRFVAALQHGSKTPFYRLNRGLIESTALKKLKVLARYR